MAEERKIRQGLQKDGEGVGSWYNTLEVWNDNFDEIRKIVDGMDPGQLESGASVYNGLSKRMNASAKLIYNQSRLLVEAWGGEDARKAMTGMDKTYSQVQEIEKISGQSGSAMSGHAKVQHQWKNSYGSGSAMDSWVKDVFNWGNRILAVNPATAPRAIGNLIGNNVGAANVMGNINDGTEQTNNNFPPGIRQDLAVINVRDTEFPDKPGPGGGPGSPKMPGGGGPPGGGPGGLPGGPGGGPEIPGGPGGPGDPPGGPGSPPGGPGGPDIPGGPGGGPGTDLATGGGPGLGGGGGGLGGGGVGGGPGSLGAGGAGAAPGGVGAGAGPGAGMVGGPGVLGKGGAGKGGMTGMGMPMGAGARGGGGDGNEHERSTWLTEDQDVWGGDDDTAPPVIG